ncbi:unnamed protein product [Brugia pahangi]|uniref:Uncharacterized protein n=1 Tax=Brugia pahangi TaxID=6280 RepID=A0A0N4T9S7_BRUPA|nr:unnamed protein product [Brugia pahangi]
MKRSKCKWMTKSVTAISKKKSDSMKRKCVFKKGEKNTTTNLEMRNALKMGIKSALKMDQARSGSMFLVHQQPDILNNTGEDGLFPIRDEWLDISNRIDDHPSAEEMAYNSASQMAYLIRERQNDESCKSSVAACDAYTSMWPQIDGLCE